MRVDRLRLLAGRMEEIAATPVEKRPRQFNLNGWWYLDDDCGTCACSIGEATDMPELQQQGFRRVWSNYEHQYVPAYDDSRQWEAVERFFELPAMQCEYLFCAYSYGPEERNDPAIVACRIRDLCAVPA